MTTHTPGPWKVNSQYGEIGSVTNSSGTVAVAQAQQVEPRSHEGRIANAHLIAAAPELLEALEIAEVICGSLTPDECPHSVLALIRNAIGKAKGV